MRNGPGFSGQITGILLPLTTGFPKKINEMHMISSH